MYIDKFSWSQNGICYVDVADVADDDDDDDDDDSSKWSTPLLRACLSLLR